jgi:hypothetical protein
VEPILTICLKCGQSSPSHRFHKSENSSPKELGDFTEKSEKIKNLLSNGCTCFNQVLLEDFSTTIQSLNTLKLSFAQITANLNSNVGRKVYWLSGKSVSSLNIRSREILEREKSNGNWFFYEHAGILKNETTLPH